MRQYSSKKTAIHYIMTNKKLLLLSLGFGSRWRVRFYGGGLGCKPLLGRLLVVCGWAKNASFGSLCWFALRFRVRIKVEC
jgi:hypothetical protein